MLLDLYCGYTLFRTSLSGTHSAADFLVRASRTLYLGYTYTSIAAAFFNLN
ncbi:MAG: hypothetical protein LPK03_15440 [Pontibacter sp.]|nr:hypothetical protein [Pontibacter sp.]